MKIAHVLQGMHVGGLESVVLNLSKYFADAGHDVAIVATDCEGPWWDRIGSFGATGVHIPSSSSMSTFAHARKIGRHLGEYDVVFLHHAPVAQAVLGMLPDSTAAVPVIHNELPVVHDVAGSNPSNWNVAIAVGPKVAETALAELGANRVVCIPNGVAAPSADVLRNRADLSGPPQLIFAGRIDNNQKGVLLLPEILASVHSAGTQASMVVIGAGPDLIALQQKFAVMGLAHAVQFLGMREPATVYEQMLASHILLLPSSFEGLPLTPIEAQACGCVVIASRLPGITDVVLRESKTGLLAPVGDASAFAAHIVDLANNPRLWRSMSAAAHEFARTEFPLEKSARAYLDVIEQLRNGAFPFPNGCRDGRVDWTLLGWQSIVPRKVVRLKRSLSRLAGNRQ